MQQIWLSNEHELLGLPFGDKLFYAWLGLSERLREALAWRDRPTPGTFHMLCLCRARLLNTSSSKGAIITFLMTFFFHSSNKSWIFSWRRRTRPISLRWRIPRGEGRISIVPCADTSRAGFCPFETDRACRCACASPPAVCCQSRVCGKMYNSKAYAV